MPADSASHARPALRILWDVALFRLRRLEMANLFAALAIMLALRLPWPEVALRLGFGLLLNLLAYLTNDYFDVDQDLRSPGRDPRKARFLRAHMGTAARLQWGLAALLAVVALLWSPDLLLPLALGAGVCWLYSWRLKRTPYLDVLAMITWGAAMPLVGCPLDSRLGWVLLGQLALLSACFESIQIIRDHDEDVAAGVRTTAVRLGVGPTRLLLRLLMVASAAYAAALLHRFIGPAMLLALALPLRRRLAGRYWNQVRMVMGLVWLAITGWIYWTGSPAGWLRIPGR
jgi:4-hydroxybenzoate polyprenyltransferase